MENDCDDSIKFNFLNQSEFHTIHSNFLVQNKVVTYGVEFQIKFQISSPEGGRSIICHSSSFVHGEDELRFSVQFFRHTWRCSFTSLGSIMSILSFCVDNFVYERRDINHAQRQRRFDWLRAVLHQSKRSMYKLSTNHSVVRTCTSCPPIKRSTYKLSTNHSARVDPATIQLYLRSVRYLWNFSSHKLERNNNSIDNFLLIKNQTKCRLVSSLLKFELSVRSYSFQFGREQKSSFLFQQENVVFLSRKTLFFFSRKTLFFSRKTFTFLVGKHCFFQQKNVVFLVGKCSCFGRETLFIQE